MERKEVSCPIYQENDIKRLYFAVGAAYGVGFVLGGVGGIANALANTRGKPRITAYLAAQSAEALGRSMALGAAAIFTTAWMLRRFGRQ
ncbi:hypothetical protein NEDG_00105 [Nematocida displodere]|uniref:Uncharacterized protein n=1 Tax=Nematocida displodere TaxID=1805483 RepID=A0A177EJS5_9MICR|nr:hypothetical protein NEDG_00105 [Nematocida displodere]